MIQVAWDCLHLRFFSSRRHIIKVQVNVCIFLKKNPKLYILYKNLVMLQSGCFFYSKDSLIHFIISHRRFICLPFVLNPYYQGKFWHMVYAHRAVWFNLDSSSEVLEIWRVIIAFSASIYEGQRDTDFYFHWLKECILGAFAAMCKRPPASNMVLSLFRVTFG